MSETSDILFLLGRLVIGIVFLYFGVNHFRHFRSMVAYAASQGTPMAGLAVPVAGTLLVLGSASVMLGLAPRVGLALLAVFLLVVTPRMHAFWRLADPSARTGEKVHFLKNAGLLGAVAVLATFPGPWPLSLLP